MARRQLLTGDERRRLFDPPADDTAIIGHYTHSSEDMELAGRRYTASALLRVLPTLQENMPPEPRAVPVVTSLTCGE